MDSDGGPGDDPCGGCALLDGRLAHLADQARVLDAERAARRSAETLAARLVQLQALTAALSRSACLDEVVQATLAQGPPALGADGAILYLHGADRTRLDLVGQSGFFTTYNDVYRSIQVGDEGLLIPAVARTGQPAWVEGPEELRRRAPVTAEHAIAIGVAAVAVLPLRVGDRASGAIIMGFHASRRFTDDERSFALTAAELCAQAFDRVLAHARALEAEARARVAAERANLAKDDFLSMLSHELRTPLTSILGWANILRTRPMEPTATARAVATIERNARAQVQLIEDILDVSRIVAGKLRIYARTADPVAIVRAAIEVVRPAAEARRILVTATLDAAVSTIVANPERLQQIALNLITNAVKFSPAGGVVELRLDLCGDGVRLQVEDHGEGIDAQFLPHVFERFRQADASQTRAHGGLGLGLAIARHLVELHHGTLTAASAGPGLGATFTVTLPRAPPGTDAPVSTRSGDPVTPVPSRLDDVRVVVVDDQPDTRELLAEILVRNGASVTAASSVREGLAAVERVRPHVLVTDIGMPGEDGYALLRRVRALPGERERRVAALALTAYAGPEAERRAELAGFQAHLAKPVLPGRLVDEVARLALPRPVEPSLAT